MDHFVLSRDGDLAVLALRRGKVNAVNHALVRSLEPVLERLRRDPGVRALVVTGTGSFFSFGFDIPEFLSFDRVDFTRFLQDFTRLYTNLFLFPKPVVAALNGHTIAGGCMLALACDRRIMASGGAKISLNEVTFGASVFAGAVEMLRACVGAHRAEEILLEGTMYSAEQAVALGLVDQVEGIDTVLEVAKSEARELGSREPVAFGSIKMLLREPIAAEMRQREHASIRDFVEIWYSEPPQKRLEGIGIHD